jgi:cytochrome b subunit of formate dehydrogenase
MEQQSEGSFLKNKSSTSGKSKAKEWLTQPLFLIFCLTVTYLAFLLVDGLILFVMGIMFADVVQHNIFFANLFEGLKIISAMIIIITYLIHTLFMAFSETKHIYKMFQESRKKEEDTL